MKTYVMSVNMSDEYIKNELVEGSLVQMNYDLEPGSAVFLYSVGASVRGVYAVASMDSCQKVESDIYNGTASIFRKENYPMLDDKDLEALQIRPNEIVEIREDGTQRAMFSLMDRTGSDLLPLPLYHMDYMTGKRYWHKDSLLMVEKFRDGLSSTVCGNVTAVNAAWIKTGCELSL